MAAPEAGQGTRGCASLLQRGRGSPAKPKAIKYGAFSQLPDPDKGETSSLELIFYFIWKSHPETLVNNKYIDSYYQEYIKNKDMVMSSRPQPKTNKRMK